MLNRYLEKPPSQVSWQKSGLVLCLFVLFFLVLGMFQRPAPDPSYDHDPLTNSQYQLKEDRKIGERYEDPLPPSQDDFSYRADSPKYMGVLPAFGPNNQYLGLKDVMYMSKLTGRILARPDFWTHSITGPQSIRKFDTTLDPTEINKYLPTVSMDEFRVACNGTIDMLIWSRPDSSWRSLLSYWLQHTNLTIRAEHRESQTLHLNTNKAIKQYFQNFTQYRCVVFTAPFRNIAESKERKQLAKHLTHASSIVDYTKIVYKEMRATKLLTIHWRWGEDSCGWWTSPEPHEDWKFCWGTSLFHFAHMDSIFATLEKIIKSEGVSTVYLAVSTLFNDPEVLAMLKEFMAKQKVELFIGSESLKTLQNITDNYFLSLIEQEICLQSQTFIWSSDSTWSDFIVNYNDAIAGDLQSFSWATLLQRNELPYSTWNRVHDVPVLNKFKRDPSSWHTKTKKKPLPA